MATNLIKNGNFSQGYGSHKAYKYTVDGEVDELQHVNEIANPKEWETSFVHGLPVPWDEENLPFDIKEIRYASDPMTSVAEGLLIKAIAEGEE